MLLRVLKPVGSPHSPRYCRFPGNFHLLQTFPWFNHLYLLIQRLFMCRLLFRPFVLFSEGRVVDKARTHNAPDIFFVRFFKPGNNCIQHQGPSTRWAPVVDLSFLIKDRDARDYAENFQPTNPPLTTPIQRLLARSYELESNNYEIKFRYTTHHHQSTGVYR